VVSPGGSHLTVAETVAHKVLNVSARAFSRDWVKHQPNTFCRASAEVAQKSGADG
jgi:hypothetical protein